MGDDDEGSWDAVDAYVAEMGRRTLAMEQRLVDGVRMCIACGVIDHPMPTALRIGMDLRNRVSMPSLEGLQLQSNGTPWRWVRLLTAEVDAAGMDYGDMVDALDAVMVERIRDRTPRP